MARRPGASLTIDCTTCPVQHIGCADCMVSALMPTAVELQPTPGPAWSTGSELPLDRREREVISRLVATGLVSAGTANGARAVHEPRSDYDELRRHAG